MLRHKYRSSGARATSIMEMVNGKAIECCKKACMFLIETSIHMVREHLLLFSVFVIALHTAISWLMARRTMVSPFQCNSLYSSISRVSMFMTRDISLDGLTVYVSSHTPR